MTSRIESLDDLQLDDKNANKGSAKGRKLIKQSLEEMGVGRSIVVDRNGKVIGGNQVLKAARELGLEIEPIYTDGDRLVVVVRNDLDMDADPEKARRLALFDNRAQEVSLEWDFEIINELREEGISLEGLWSDDELVAAAAAQDEPELPPAEDDSFDDDKEKMPHTCPNCGHQWGGES